MTGAQRRRAFWRAKHIRFMRSLNAFLLPDDFDDDTRIAEAVLRYHPPRAWTAC